MTMTYLVGDVFARMADIPDGSVSAIECSPPFMDLRSYLAAGHPLKHLEIGAEATPGAFLDTLLALTAEWGRILAPWGSIAIELGDTMSGSGGGGGDYYPGGMREGQPGFSGSAAAAREFNAANWRQRNQPVRDERHARGGDFEASRARAAGKRSTPYPGWPGAKSLALIPQAYALSLAYGRNVLTGAESPAGSWLVRNVVVWHRPNPAVGALSDKVRPSTSYITVATRSPQRWFDLTAIRTLKDIKLHTDNRGGHVREDIPGRTRQTMNPTDEDGHRIQQNAAGSPPLDCWFDEYDEHDVWTITSAGSKLAHYAMWPPKLAERLTLMLCPLEVCRSCGEPRRRIERRESTGQNTRTSLGMKDDPRQIGAVVSSLVPEHSNITTLGWTHCGCAGTPTSWKTVKVPRIDRETGEQEIGDDGQPRWRNVRVLDDLGTSTDPEQYRPGVVLDPFAGTGTTLCVAEIHGRDSIGIDLDARNESYVAARMAQCRRVLLGVTGLKGGRKAAVGQEELAL